LARIVLPVGEVQLRCFFDSGAEVSLIYCKALKCLDPCNYVLDDSKENTFVSINGSENGCNHSDWPFDTPIVVVEQRDKSRVCLDFRELGLAKLWKG
jgi:hypothetical protein